MSRSSRVRRTNSCWRSMVGILSSARVRLVTTPGSLPGRGAGLHAGVERGTGEPLVPADVPVAEAVGLFEPGAGTGDLDDVAAAEVVVEPAGVRRGDVQAAVRDV